MGGIHAIEHASIALFPLFALCDRNDVGGICYPIHPQLEKPAIFIYDGYPGGVGLADYGYGILEELLRKTRVSDPGLPLRWTGAPRAFIHPSAGGEQAPGQEGRGIVLEYLLGEPGSGERETGFRPAWGPIPWSCRAGTLLRRIRLE